jgi:hypothetical protein
VIVVESRARIQVATVCMCSVIKLCSCAEV